jgi:HPt (histidine-containing phosphotransfer) domain-containing protein
VSPKKSKPDQTIIRGDAPTKSQTDAQIDKKINNVLAELWKKNLPTVYERLDLLDKFGTAAASGKLDEPTRIEALNIAHKLAGSLGMYGYQQGTEVASKMERILKSPTPETLLTLRALAADLRKSLAPRPHN